MIGSFYVIREEYAKKLIEQSKEHDLGRGLLRIEA